MIGMQLGSRLGSEFELATVDTSRGKFRWAVESPTWRTPFFLARDVGRLVGALVRFRPQVVLVHGSSSLSFLRDWVLMVISRLASAKVVCHYHGTAHARFPSCETVWGRRLGRFLMRAADRVIVLGPTYQRVMGEAWKRSIDWSPNTCEVELFEASRPTPPPWLEPGDRAILFVGRLSAPKGLYDLFDAAPQVLERHPDARFVLAGVAENDELEPVVRAEAARRGIAERVTFLGHVAGEDKVSTYAASQLLVVPSWTEAFPLVIPEGMAAGLPIVATAVGAVPDFVADGVDGFLVSPHDPAALADRIGRLLEDEGLRERIAETVRARAARDFAVDVGARRVGEVVHGVLRERNG
jgi:glycosyltransferase involved in cell wall biosynthesis